MILMERQRKFYVCIIIFLRIVTNMVRMVYESVLYENVISIIINNKVFGLSLSLNNKKQR